MAEPEANELPGAPPTTSVLPPDPPSPDGQMDDRWEDGIANGARAGLEWTKSEARRLGLTPEQYIEKRRMRQL